MAERRENEGEPRPPPLQHDDMNQPFPTVRCTHIIPHPRYISCSVNISPGDGIGPLGELGLETVCRVPYATADGQTNGTAVGESTRYT